jgi:hypothetical protein
MKPWIPVVWPRLLYALGHLSPLGPGGIWNLTLFPFIISADPIDEVGEAHEGIHIWQQLECGVVGGLCLAPLLAVVGAPWWAFVVGLGAGFLPLAGWFYWVYVLTFLYWWRIIKRDHSPQDRFSPGEAGYYLIPFEREAYLYDGDGLSYFKERKLFAWLRISDDEVLRKGMGRPKKLYLRYQRIHFWWWR